jgi:hypothetical protein
MVATGLRGCRIEEWMQDGVVELSRLLWPKDLSLYRGAFETAVVSVPVLIMKHL